MPTAALELFAEPDEPPFNSIAWNGITTIVAGGIVNPFGPTLNALALEEPRQQGDPRALLHIVINPFSQMVTQPGVVQPCSMEQLVEEVLPYAVHWFGACPTLIMPSLQLSAASSHQFLSRLLAPLNSSTHVLAGVRKHPGDPWARVQDDVDGLGTAPKTPKHSEKRLADDEARELAAHLLDPDYQRAELQAFLFAWNGSIEFQGANLLARQSMSLDACAHVLACLAMTCRIPAFGEQ